MVLPCDHEAASKFSAASRWAPRGSPKGLHGFTVEMAIVRAQQEVFESVEGIHFLMRDPEARKNVPCVITREALAERGAAHVPPLAPLGVFEAYRGEIERLANECWERGEVDDRGILRVTSSQFE
jgi:uncharacterized protein DUF1488